MVILDKFTHIYMYTLTINRKAHERRPALWQVAARVYTLPLSVVAYCFLKTVFKIVPILGGMP